MQPCCILLAPQTIKALDEMVQALVMQEMNPDMNILQKFLEVSGCGSGGKVKKCGCHPLHGNQDGQVSAWACWGWHVKNHSHHAQIISSQNAGT